MMTSTSKDIKPNSLYFDEYGRPNGILLVDKPAGVTSHDIVAKTRRDLGYKKVGHAGALDVFSSGLLIILIGKSTKLSDTFLNKDKSYKARIIFGIETETQDPEGEILKLDTENTLNEAELQQVLKSFGNGYSQYVSIYSSVKVGGKKLRKVLREKNWEHEVIESATNKILKFRNINEPAKEYEIEVPRRDIKLYALNLEAFGKIKATDLPFIAMPDPETEFKYADIYVTCSKGTYIRQLAEDIARKAGTVGALATLRRVHIGDWSEADAITSEDISSFKSPTKVTEDIQAADAAEE